jgi:hypothetical protein
VLVSSTAPWLGTFRLLRHDVAEGTSQSTADQVPDSTAIRIGMRHVRFRYEDSLSISIERLIGTMAPRRDGGTVTFDEPASFSLAINAATIGLALGDAERLLNTRVFNHPESPLRSLHLSVADKTLLLIKGDLNRAGSWPFSAVGRVRASGGRWLAFEPRELKLGPVPVTNLLHLLGIDLKKLLGSVPSDAVMVKGDTLFIEILRVLPDPQIVSELADITCCSPGIVVGLGSKGIATDSALVSLASSFAQHPNLIAIRGGVLRFGKLTMNQSDLDLVDANPNDEFDFYLQNYHCQLVAGSSSATPDYGWRVRMPDYGALAAEACHRPGTHR